MSQLNDAIGKERAANLIPEFERCIREAAPEWFVMENVVKAPPPAVPGYHVRDAVVRDHWCGGHTMRKRRFSFGSAGDPQGWQVETLALHLPDPEVAITSCARKGHVWAPDVEGGRYVLNRGPRLPIGEMARRQGLPEGFFGKDCPFTTEAQRKMLGNGVPLAMGRAVAAAVLRAIRRESRAA